MSASAEAYYYYSNDPKGNMFLKRPYGDMVNCGPLSALMLKKFSNKSSSFEDIHGAIETTRMDVQEQDKEDLSYRWWSIRDIKSTLLLLVMLLF